MLSDVKLHYLYLYLAINFLIQSNEKPKKTIDRLNKN